MFCEESIPDTKPFPRTESEGNLDCASESERLLQFCKHPVLGAGVHASSLISLQKSHTGAWNCF